MVLTHLVLFSFFNGAGTAATPVVVTEVPGGSSKRRRKQKQGEKPRVIRWSDFATQEERAQALAQALAQSSVPLSAPQEEFDDIADEDDALIHALLLSKVIN